MNINRLAILIILRLFAKEIILYKDKNCSLSIASSQEKSALYVVYIILRLFAEEIILDKDKNCNVSSLESREKCTLYCTVYSFSLNRYYLNRI